MINSNELHTTGTTSFAIYGETYEIRYFDENLEPYELICEGRFIGSFDSEEEAETAAYWHARHM